LHCWECFRKIRADSLFLPMNHNALHSAKKPDSWHRNRLPGFCVPSDESSSINQAWIQPAGFELYDCCQTTCNNPFSW
jgi:hypothetical protein